MSPKPKPKTPPASKARATGGKQASPTKSRPAPKRPAAARAVTAAKPRFPVAWALAGAALITIVAVAVISGLSGGSSSPATGSGSGPAASAELVRNTKLARVPLLTAEGLATHTHTTLVVTVNGKEKQVPAGIGIDPASGHIAALHTHDTSGLVHLESAKENDTYTLEQFLTVWGMPTDAAGRCAFFGAKSPCTLSATSKDSGPVGLDVKLKDDDTLTLTVTST